MRWPSWVVGRVALLPASLPSLRGVQFILYWGIMTEMAASITDIIPNGRSEYATFWSSDV